MGFVVLVLAELAIPMWAESAGGTSYHPEHIVERYGLFTIIVLGESILSASAAVQTYVNLGRFDAFFVQTVIGAVLIVFSMWWYYFQQAEQKITGAANSLALWAYGHFFVFASAAAVGAGLSAYVDFNALGQGGSVLANAAVVIPVVVYLLSVGLVHRQLQFNNSRTWLFLFSLTFIIACIWSRSAVFFMGLLMLFFTVSQQYLAYRFKR